MIRNSLCSCFVISTSVCTDGSGIVVDPGMIRCSKRARRAGKSAGDEL